MVTVLREASVLDMMRKLAEKNTDKNQNNHYLGGSISRYTKDLTMTFPTLVDNSLTPETASMISKAHERNIVSMIQMLFASMQLTGSDGRDIIRQIYGNKNGLSGMSYDDYMESLSKYYKKHRDLLPSGASNLFECTLSEDAMADAVKKMQDELKRPMKAFPVDSFSDNSLNDYSVININGTEKVKFNPIKEEDSAMAKGWMPDEYGFVHRNLYAKDGKFGDPALPDANTSNVHNQALNYKYNRQHQLYQQKMDKKKFKYQKQMDAERMAMQRDQLQNQKDTYELNKDKFQHQQDMDRLHQRQMNSQMRKDQTDLLNRQLMDSDIKKANEIQPTLIIVNYSEVDPQDQYRIIDQRSFIAGVKSRLISVSSSDILERIVAKNKTRINFLNFIRATTGEISFMKDFILCLKQTKIDAKNAIKRGAAADMWKTLEALSVKNNRNKLRKSGNDASAITTLVINQETVNLIAKEYEIDVENLTTARQIMNDYNLLGIIIADESIEVVKFLYDGQDMFEQQAYSFLEKENNDKSYKKIINLMSQNRRF